MTKNRFDGLGLVRTEVRNDDDRHTLGGRPHHCGVARLDDGRVLGFDDPRLNRIEVTGKAGK